MTKEVRILRASDASAYESLVEIISADLKANNTKEFLYIQPPADRAKAMAEGRVVGYFVDNALCGVVTFQEGFIDDILRRRFPDVAGIPESLDYGVYTSNGMVSPDARGNGAMTDMLLHVASLHPDQSLYGTIHHQNERQIKVRQRIGSYPVATLHSPMRSPMVLYVRLADVADEAAVA